MSRIRSTMHIAEYGSGSGLTCWSFRMSCVCFMPRCALCDATKAAPVDHGPAVHIGMVAASRPCSCYMPDCVQCVSIVAAEAEAEVDCSDTERAAPLHLTGIAAARGSTSAGKRKRKCCPKPGHVKCTLAQELEEDRKGSQAESFDARIAVLASVCILMLQPALSVLEYIGRPRGERWDFWEVYSGCGNFTAAALAAGLVVGPPVDLLHKAGGLALDLLSQDNQALLQAVLEEARPRWLHLAPPCTFWTAIGRWTASRTPETWALLRAQAKELWLFALQLAFLQSQHGGKGSLEQPPRCASWGLRCTEQFYAACPDWQHYVWPSCAYGMCDPVSGAPWQKMQGFFSNADLGELACRRCQCVRHGWIQGQIKSGPRHGERRTTIAGEYPVQMCQALASVVRLEVRTVP